MAKNIVNRDGEKLAKGILDIMGIDLLTDGSVKIREESVHYENDHKIRWIETLLQIPIPDHRKYALWRIITPYLINIRKLSHEDALSIIRVWLDKCSKLKPLIGVNDRIKPDLNAAVRIGYLPISLSDLETENRQLTDLISSQMKDDTKVCANADGRKS